MTTDWQQRAMDLASELEQLRGLLREAREELERLARAVSWEQERVDSFRLRWHESERRRREEIAALVEAEREERDRLRAWARAWKRGAKGWRRERQHCFEAWLAAERRVLHPALPPPSSYAPDPGAPLQMRATGDWVFTLQRRKDVVADEMAAHRAFAPALECKGTDKLETNSADVTDEGSPTPDDSARLSDRPGPSGAEHGATYCAICGAGHDRLGPVCGRCA